MMRIESLEFGRSISGDPPDVLLRHSKEEYDSLVRRIIRTGLAFREEDLDDDFAKHAPKFGITSRGEYARMARQEVRNASKILAQNHFGELQILFFGERGHVVVDLSMRIRGYYPHLKEGAVDKAFEALKRERLWLKTGASAKN